MPKLCKAYLEAKYEQAFILVNPGDPTPKNIDEARRVREVLSLRGNEIDATGRLIPIWPFEEVEANAGDS